MAFSLGGRAVSFALCQLGCSVELALAIGFAVRALLSSEAAPYLGNMMLPTGGISGEDRQIHAGVAHHSPANPASEGTSGTKLPLPSSASSPVPSLSGASDSWIEKCYGDPAEASSSPPDDRGPRLQGEGALFQPTPPYDLPQPPRVVEQAGPSQIAPPSPSSTGAGPANAFPEVDQPLLADGERRQKLEERPCTNPVASPGAAQEALPQAPAPAEVPHPAPDQEERAALLGEIRALVVQLLREESERGLGRLSFHFPEMREGYSSAAESIMSHDLEISRETDAESLREWAERIRHDPNLLKPLFKDYLIKRR